MADPSSSPRTRLSRRLAASFVAGGLIALVASCGSRTGLFVPDGEFTSVIPVQDASIDAAPDAVGCTPGKFTFELALTQLMFVIDRSGSMAFTLDGTLGAPRPGWRWAILENSLRKTITTFDNQIAMGAKFFPEVLSQSDLDDSLRACQVDTGAGIAPAKGNASAILNVFDRTTPRGGTPTSEAIRTAASALQQTRSVARAIVLATDGAPNCNGDLDARSCTCTSSAPCDDDLDRGRYSCLDDNRTIKTIRDVADGDRIPVYVIGIGGTESPAFLDVLDDMAVAGGRPQPTRPFHYSAQSEADLTNALTTIRDSVARCTYLTPSAPTNPDDITVQVDGQIVSHDTTKRNGWEWVDREFGAIAFFGAACTRAQGAAGQPAIVSGVVRCE